MSRRGLSAVSVVRDVDRAVLAISFCSTHMFHHRQPAHPLMIVSGMHSVSKWYAMKAGLARLSL
jgi:hypothetical protein